MIREIPVSTALIASGAFALRIVALRSGLTTIAGQLAADNPNDAAALNELFLAGDELKRCELSLLKYWSRLRQVVLHLNAREAQPIAGA